MKSKGFTLIELLVVVAIIGILATVVLASLGSARARARDAKRQVDIKSIQTQLELYYLDNGRYPISGWASSSDPTQWANLSTDIGIDLPEDPVNSGTPASGGASSGLTYSYYGSGFGCQGQWYMLVYQLESTTNPDSPGIDSCTTFFNYTGSNRVTVGMNNAL